MKNLSKKIQKKLNKVRKAIEKTDEEIAKNHYDMRVKREMCSTDYMNRDSILSNKIRELRSEETKLLNYLG